jgi:hypothetical protein
MAIPSVGGFLVKLGAGRRGALYPLDLEQCGICKENGAGGFWRTAFL